MQKEWDNGATASAIHWTSIWEVDIKLKKTVLKRTYGAMYPMGGGHAIKIVLKGNNGEINKGNILACTCTVKMW